MRVDEDGVAIRLSETWNIKYPAAGQRSFEIATPIHVNPTQVSTDSVDGRNVSSTGGRR